MNNTYYAVTFTSPAEFAQDGYMVVDPANAITFASLQGVALTLPEPCEYHITSPQPQAPAWGS